jgi:hypothetical protein
MFIKFNLQIHDKEGLRPRSLFVHVEVTENTTKTELLQKVLERSKEFTITEPKSCAILVDGKEMANDWTKSNRDGKFTAKIIKE